jgi:hypothetical protein
VRYTIHPLTPELWPALEELFGEKGACSGCWCMYWRIGSAYRKPPRSHNKAAFRAIVDGGPPPGLLAFDGDVPSVRYELASRRTRAKRSRRS